MTFVKEDFDEAEALLFLADALLLNCLPLAAADVTEERDETCCAACLPVPVDRDLTVLLCAGLAVDVVGVVDIDSDDVGATRGNGDDVDDDDVATGGELDDAGCIFLSPLPMADDEDDDDDDDEDDGADVLVEVVGPVEEEEEEQEEEEQEP